jgi:methylmalonyl-CoA mutase N-terminal domain/subunit
MDYHDCMSSLMAYESRHPGSTTLTNHRHALAYAALVVDGSHIESGQENQDTHRIRRRRDNGENGDSHRRETETSTGYQSGRPSRNRRVTGAGFATKRTLA